VRKNPLELVTLQVRNNGGTDITRYHRTFPPRPTTVVRVPRGRALEITACGSLDCEELPNEMPLGHVENKDGSDR
jgi:hypothetical protein